MHHHDITIHTNELPLSALSGAPMVTSCHLRCATEQVESSSHSLTRDTRWAKTPSSEPPLPMAPRSATVSCSRDERPTSNVRRAMVQTAQRSSTSGAAPIASVFLPWTFLVPESDATSRGFAAVASKRENLKFVAKGEGMT